jgi:hypothetical protein
MSAAMAGTTIVPKANPAMIAFFIVSLRTHTNSGQVNPFPRLIPFPDPKVAPAPHFKTNRLRATVCDRFLGVLFLQCRAMVIMMPCAIEAQRSFLQRGRRVAAAWI